MKELDYLVTDLELHQKRRLELIKGTGKSVQFLLDAGIHLGSLITSYDKIIKSLKQEIKEKKK